MAYNIKHVDLDIRTCNDVNLSMKHGKKRKKQGDLSQKHKESKKHARKAINHVIQAKRAR